MPAAVVDSVPLLMIVPLSPTIDAARALTPDVETVPVLIKMLLIWPVATDVQIAAIP